MGLRDRWESFKRRFTHCDCGACGKSVDAGDGYVRYYSNAPASWTCNACLAINDAYNAKLEREERIKKHMRDLAEKHEAMMRFEARHGIYRGLPAGAEGGE